MFLSIEIAPSPIKLLKVQQPYILPRQKQSRLSQTLSLMVSLATYPPAANLCQRSMEVLFPKQRLRVRCGFINRKLEQWNLERKFDEDIEKSYLNKDLKETLVSKWSCAWSRHRHALSLSRITNVSMIRIRITISILVGLVASLVPQFDRCWRHWGSKILQPVLSAINFKFDILISRFVLPLTIEEQSIPDMSEQASQPHPISVHVGFPISIFAP